jgi:hypothetical protein
VGRTGGKAPHLAALIFRWDGAGEIPASFRCGACGLGSRKPWPPGGVGAPPGDTTIPCQELADGEV